jgi:hypothetical protein
VITAADWAYVGGAYGVVIASLVAYATFVILRGRRAGQQLPAEERRWTQ